MSYTDRSFSEKPTKEEVDRVRQQIRQFWSVFLELALQGVDLDQKWEPWKDFEVPFEGNVVVAAAFKVYSLETPIYCAINKPWTELDEESAELLAPFAWYFSVISHTQQLRRVEVFPKHGNHIALYRGLKLTDGEIQEYGKRAGKDGIRLRGFTNLSRDRQLAIYHAQSDPNIQGKPVLFEIILYKSKPGWFYLDNAELTAFPDEQEVLVKEGWPFFVKKQSQAQEGGQTLVVVTLHQRDLI